MEQELIKITDFLVSDKGFSTMVLNEILVIDNNTKEEVVKPFLIFKEFEEKISEIKKLGNVSIEVKYEFFIYKNAWCMPIVVRLDKQEINTYMSFYDLNHSENVALLEKLNTNIELGILFYNEKMLVTHTLALKNNPFYHKLNVVIKELKKYEFTEERKKDFTEMKRQVLDSCNNSAIEYFNSL